LLLYSSHLPLGVPNGLVIYHASSHFFGAIAGEEVEDFCEGSFLHTHPLLFYCFVLLYLFYLHHFLSIPKKIRILGSCFYLSTFSFAEMANPENTKLCDFTSTNNSDFIYTPIAPPAPAGNFYEIKPTLLNLVMKEQFSSASTEDAVAHLNNFVELCERQKYKDVESDIIKLKNSIDSWTKCKDAFIGRYYPPVKLYLCIAIL
jgi:hypothetical protein